MVAVAAFAFVTSAAFFPALALALDRRGRLGVLSILLVTILFSPLLVSTSSRFGRFLVAVLAVALSAKLFDFPLGALRGHRPDLRTFLAFLPNLTSVVLRKLDAEHRPGRLENLARLLAFSLASAPGALLLVHLFRVDWRRLPSAVEHGAKAVASFLAPVPIAAAGVAAWRLLGGRAREPMDNPLAARTPADF